MSLGEMLVVVIVSLLVIKPEDIPIILKQIHHIKSYFTKLKSEFINQLNKELKNEDSEEALQNLEELNLYLQKIISLEGRYEGDYSKEKLKAKYHQLIQQKIDSEKNN